MDDVGTLDFDQIAQEFGGTVSATPPAATPASQDWESIAKEFGGSVSTKPPQSKASAPDWNSIAKEFGGTVSGVPPQPPGSEKTGLPGLPGPKLPAALQGGHSGEVPYDGSLGMRAAPEPGFWERVKGTILGSPRSGDTPIGRALGDSYEAPSEKHVPTTSLPMARISELAPEITQAAGAVIGGGTPGMALANTDIGKGIGKGVAQAAEGLTTVPNLLMAAGSEGFGLLAQVSKILPRAVSAGFSVQMLHDAYNQFPAVKRAWDSGDPKEIADVITQVAIEGGMGALAGTHAIRGVHGDISSSIEEHNQEAQRLFEKEKAQPSENPLPGEFVLGAEKIPVTIDGKELQIVPAGMGADRAPYYQLVDSAGKPIFGGYGGAMQEYLRVRGAEHAPPPLPDTPTPIVDTAGRTGPSSPRRRWQRDINPTTPPPLPIGESAAEEAAPPPTSDLDKGTTFDTPQGKLTIVENDGRLVSYQIDTPSGPQRGTRPVAIIRKMVGSVAPTLPESTSSATPSPAASAPEQQPNGSVAPTAPETAAATPSTPAAPEAQDTNVETGPSGEKLFGSGSRPKVPFSDIVDFLRTKGKGSVSQLQREFQFGYGTAQAAIDHATDLGILGPEDGSKPRELLKTEETKPVTNPPEQTEQAVVTPEADVIQPNSEPAIPEQSGATQPREGVVNGRRVSLQEDGAPLAYLDEPAPGTEIKPAEDRPVVSQEDGKPLAYAEPAHQAVPNQEAIDKLPPVAPGMVRLYRGVAGKGSGVPAPDWVKDSPKYAGIRLATGRWFTEDPKIAQWYVNDAKDGKLAYLDVPKDVVESSRVANIPEARRFSADPHNELFLPKEYAGKATTIQDTAANDHNYSSTQFNLPAPIASAIKKFGESIPKDLLVDKGVETEPHTTILYGLKDNISANVEKVLQGENAVPVKLGRTSVFKTPEADVLKLDVESPELHALNAKVATLDHKSDYPQFVPHVTIAYLKSGTSDPYVDKVVVGATGMKPTLDTVKFSPADGEAKNIPLQKSAAKTSAQQIAENEKRISDLTEQLQAGRDKAQETADRLRESAKNARSENEREAYERQAKLADAKAALFDKDLKAKGKEAAAPKSVTPQVTETGIEAPAKLLEPRPEPAPPSPVGIPTPVEALADAVYQKLKTGQSLGNVTELNKLAEQHFGSSRASGQWTPKDAFDAMEAGVNKHLIDRGSDLLSMPYDQAMTELRELMGRITSQGVRTEEQIQNQQFSTPPTEAFTAAKVAGIKPSDIVLEPSAGNGGLAVWPKSIESRVYVNELSDRRRAMLETVGFPNPTAHDGEIINSLLDPGIKPTVILMNPPFSAGTVKSGKAANDNKYGFNHVDSALQRLAPNGRLVAILGGGRANDPNGGATLFGGPSGRWFTDLAKRYNVRANVRINGKEYQKYGTAFATRIIVIDKNGPTPSRVAATPSWDSVVKGVADTLEQAYTLLKDVAESRPELEAVSAGAVGTRKPESGTAEVGTGNIDSGSAGGVLQGGSGTPGAIAVGRPARPGRPTGSSAEPGASVPDERVDLREPGTGPQESTENSTPGAAQGSAQNADIERPLPNQPGDVIGGAGLTRQQIIAAAAKRLAEKTGRTRALTAPVQEPVSAPTAVASKPENAMSAAADEARKRLRDKLRKQGPNEEPIRYSIEYRAEPDPLDAETLIDLSSIGAEHILNGATTFEDWSKRFNDDVGDLVGEIAKSNAQAAQDIARQVYDLSREVAKEFGGNSEPAPSAPDSLTGAPLDGYETDSAPLSIEENVEPKSAEEEDSDAYVTYRPTLAGPAHPGSIVETKTMSTVPLPKITYRPNLPEAVTRENRLSAVQLEGISIAGQQNDLLLPSGHRGSALIGDGTGLGKGREAAGILLDNWNQGRKRLVWVSVKWDLIQDAMRDLDGIGAKELLQGNNKKANGQYTTGSTSSVQPFSRYKYGEKINHKGVLFSTYALIRSENNKGGKRVNDLEQYLRGDDDGEGAYIVFDESHILKNAVVGQGGKPSQIGVAVKELMQRIPKLRSVSLSATAATDVMNLGYLDRLGLWGPGTPFPTGFNEFASQISGGRLAAMEMVARELKAQGKYVSRTLSFKGVTYSEEEHQITPEQRELYRTAATAWKSVIQQAEQAIQQTTKGGARQKSRFMAQLGSTQQRFFNLLITALKTPTAVSLANQALADGKSVVITLVNTNEAAQNREKNRVSDSEDEDEIPDYDFGPKKLLTDLVEQHFPVQQYRDDVDNNGNPIKVPVTRIDAEGREIPVNNPEAERMRDELVKQINRDLHMPENPLDILINSLGGPNKVAELTGRKERFDSSIGKFVPRGDESAARKDVNLIEMRNFQSGKKRLAVLSAAADTGISLHSGLDVANQQPRYHITLQAGWSADKAMQMFGRTHRTNQAHPPEYVLLVSDLGGEKRFISTIARRLGSLGALTKGQKNASSGTDLMDKVNFETEQGTQATTAFYDSLLKNVKVPGTNLTGMQILTDLRVLKGDPLTVPPADRGNVTRLLNRLLALDPDVQNPVYNYFYDIFQAAIQRAIEAGTLDTGVKTLPGDEFSIKEARSISKDPATGAETFYFPVEAKVRTNRVSPKDLEKRLRNHADKNPRILVRNTGKLAIAYDANPIVHASGSLEPASYLATAGNGNWAKTSNHQLNRSLEVNDWATQEHEKAKNEVRSAQHSLDYREKSVASSVEYGRQREERTLRSQLATSADPESINKKIEALKDYKLPEGSWEVKSRDEAEAILEEAKKVLAEKEEIAKNPKAWAVEQWKQQYEESPAHVSEEHHLIGGAVMRFWNPIREASMMGNIYTTVDSKTGQRVVGVDIPQEAIGPLLARITGGASTVNTRQVILDVLRNNLTYSLEGNIQVRRGRLGRENIIQLIPANPEQASNLKSLGVLYERGVVPTYYIPNAEHGPREKTTYSVLSSVLDQYPVKPDRMSDVDEEPERYSLESKRQSASDAPMAQYRSGVLWVNPSMMEKIARAVGGPSKVGGVYIPPKMAQDLPDKVRASSEVKQAIRDAIVDRRSITIVVQRPGVSLSELKAAARHELFHATEIWAGPSRGYELLKGSSDVHGIATKASVALGRKGYDRSDIPLVWSEIGAHLASGPVGWSDLNLNRDEAKRLFRKYLTLLDPETISKLRSVAPQLNEELNAARSINEARSRIRAAIDRKNGETETGTGSGELRPGVREGVSTEPARHSRLVDGREKESGKLSNLKEFLSKLHGNNAPRSNYSGLGGLERVFLPGRNLADVRKASKEVFRSAARAASSEAIASNIISNAVPAIIEALKGSGITWDDLRLYYTESRLRGIRQRWYNFADQAATLDADKYQELTENSRDGSLAPLIDLLSNIQGRQGIKQNLGQSAAALMQAHDWGNLRDLMVQSFQDAGDRVKRVAHPDNFDFLHNEVSSNPRVKEADRLYGELVEKPIAENHALNEGVFSDALGPANRYIPLTPFERETKSGPGRRLPFHKPRNIANAFATGLSEDYDIGMASLAKRISSGIRSNDKASLISTMSDTGWLKPEASGYKTSDGKLAMEGPDGVEYLATREERSPSRVMVKDGKVIRTQAHFGVMPTFMNRAMKVILAGEPMDANDVIKAMRWANMLSTKGPQELVFHTSGVLGALYSNTPFLGKSGLDKALSAPLVKWFTIRQKLFSVDPTTPENVEKLRKMAEVGALPSRSGKVTYSQAYADMTGATRERFSFSPLLYGPKGVDARARILMFDIFEAAYPHGTPEQLHDFVNQLGNYTPEMQGEIERGLKRLGIGPFATAGMTRIVNGVHSFSGMGPGKGGTTGSKIMWWLTASGWIALAAWYVAHKALTGKTPNGDPRAKAFKIPVGGGSGYIDQFRHSKLGNAWWGDGPEVGYLDFAFLDNPLAERGARAIGLSGAMETLNNGGSLAQASEAAGRDVVNSLSHPATGPAVRAMFVGLTGKEPYVTDTRDRGGQWSPSLFPAVNPKTRPGSETVAAHGWAAAKQLNSFFLGGAENIGESTGFLQPRFMEKGNPWVQTGTNIVAPGLLGKPSNPFNKEKILHNQRRGQERF